MCTESMSCYSSSWVWPPAKLCSFSLKSACCPCVFFFSFMLWVLHFPPTVQKHACEVNWKLSHRCKYECECIFLSCRICNPLQCFPGLPSGLLLLLFHIGRSTQRFLNSSIPSRGLHLKRTINCCFYPPSYLIKCWFGSHTVQPYQQYLIDYISILRGLYLHNETLVEILLKHSLHLYVT